MFIPNNLNRKILLSNLILIRWVAILGQLAAILSVHFILKISLPVYLCLILVIISAFVNILTLNFKKKRDYLTELEAFYFLLYDTCQLAILLFLTGGIYNPFSLLLIAPVVISASFLKIGYTVFLLCFSVAVVILISNFYTPIIWSEDFAMPTLFTIGLIVALIISLIFIAVYVYILANSSRKISNALNQTHIALINQKKISDIGAIAAAAVHEFSTPLNTIFLILNDLAKDKTLSRNVQSEINLLNSQANRCKEILLNLSKMPPQMQDSFIKKTTISNLIKQNFAKFNNKKIKLNISFADNLLENEPQINFSDEIMYALSNLIQNATQHAKNRIDIIISWSKQNINLIIKDDGNGFSNEILEKIGTPYISDNISKKGLGLGIFIAKNFIENLGGQIFFSNNKEGAIIEISILREA